MTDEQLYYFGGSLKDATFRGGSRKTNIEGGLPKKGAGTVYRFTP